MHSSCVIDKIIGHFQMTLGDCLPPHFTKTLDCLHHGNVGRPRSEFDLQ